MKLDLSFRLLALIAVITAGMLSLSCTVHINPDGSKDATVDAPSAIRVIEILAAK